VKIRNRFVQIFSLVILLTAAPAFAALVAGDVAPAFSAKNQDGQTVQLSDFKGKYVLVYFYPKDDTPGCTKEACSFRDEYAKIKKLNTVVLGVSRQDGQSHQEFRSKHKLPFDLLVDADGSLAKAYSVPTMPIVGFTKRQSILIGPDGKVLHFYQDVDPSTHVQQVMTDIESNAGTSAPKNK
jgi:peroxiredoxin Q/BCP